MHGRPLGTLNSKASGHVELVYDEHAIADPMGLGLSMSMPLVGRRYRGAVVTNWLQGLLPDRSEVLRRWRREFGVRRLDVFSLLWHVGEDVAGAAQFIRPDRLETIAAPDTLSPVSTDEIAARLRALRSDQTAWGLSAATGQFSLAGAQAKFALHRTDEGWAEPSGQVPTTHIFKPAIPNLDDQDLVEHLTMRTAGLLGLAVPGTALEVFGDERTLVVQRFDRARTATGWVRVHQEDMCQAAGMSPETKYEEQGGPGVSQIAGLIRQAVPRAHVDNDVGEFLRAVGFNWLVVGTDAHAKNYGLLHAPGRSRLAPLYDLNSYLPHGTGAPLNLSMKIGPWQRSADRIRASDWAAMAEEVRLRPDTVISDLRDMAERLTDAAHDAAAAEVAALNTPLAGAFVDAIAARAAQCIAWLG
jgi:serine/threonine-protein kinase HipA